MTTITSKSLLTPEQIIIAREWLTDLDFDDITPAEINNLSDRSITLAIAQHFDGGIAGFVATLG